MPSTGVAEFFRKDTLDGVVSFGKNSATLRGPRSSVAPPYTGRRVATGNRSDRNSQDWKLRVVSCDVVLACGQNVVDASSAISEESAVESCLESAAQLR